MLSYTLLFTLICCLHLYTFLHEVESKSDSLYNQAGILACVQHFCTDTCKHSVEQISCLTMTESEETVYSEKCIMSCDDDLEFINKMRMENSLSGIRKVCSSKDLLIHKGRRRNSSFAEFFEGDLTQNLLSRKNFVSRDCGSFSDTVSSIVKVKGKGEIMRIWD